jgi:hypothetical protein
MNKQNITLKFDTLIELLLLITKSLGNVSVLM